MGDPFEGREPSLKTSRPTHVRLMSPKDKILEGAGNLFSVVKAAAGKLKGNVLTEDELQNLTQQTVNFPSSVPTWDAPSDYVDCFDCKIRKHKHHCRLCGHMFCPKCTNKFEVPERFELKKKKGASRVCISCEKQYLDKAGKWTRKTQVAKEAPVRTGLRTDHREVPDWVPDGAYNACFHCQVQNQRMRHCRLCGERFCERCRLYCEVPPQFEKKGKKMPVPVCYGCELDCRVRSESSSPLPPNFINEYGVWKVLIPEWEMPSLYADCSQCHRKSGKGHNCRLCGKLFCGVCTSKLKVPEAFEKKSKVGLARTCDRCRYVMQPKLHAKLVCQDVVPETQRKKDELSAADVQHVLSLPGSSPALFQKLQSSACAGCGLNFGLFARRQKCFHCPVSWCNRCIKSHQIGLEAQRPKRVVTRLRGYSQLKRPSLITVDPATMIGELKDGGGALNLSGIVQEEEEGGSELNDNEADQGNNNHAAMVDLVVEEEGDEGTKVEEDGPKKWFEVAGRLGEGSYGAVYRATDKRDATEVAIKVLEREGEGEAKEALEREIAFLKGCDSPYLVAYKGSYKVDEHTWIVMEYCSGGSFCDLMEISETTLTEQEIAVVMRETLLGLQYLHSNNKLHRDIKAGNILATPEGLCKLTDFGVSCVLESAESKRKTTIGSPYWMAPEVIKGKPYDGKADIWSLGITALELAKGVPPNLDVHPMRVLFKIPLLPSPTLPDPENWSKDFNDFVARCVQKETADRPTAQELLSHPFIVQAGPVSIIGLKVQECMADIEAFREREMAELQHALENAAKKQQRVKGAKEVIGGAELATSVFATGTIMGVDVEGEGEEDIPYDMGTMVAGAQDVESSVVRSDDAYVPEYTNNISFQ